ncbi:sugar phosphate isomerase/epimerase family protein [Xanthobacteraceae bacterium A53D]
MDVFAQQPAVLGVGYSIRATSPDFEDLGAKLDEAERLGVDFVELPTFAWTLAVGGRILPERLKKLVEATRNRPFGYTVHGPLAINLMDLPNRLARHEALLAASIEIAGALGAENYVMHAGVVREQEDDIEVAYSRQRDALARAGDLAAKHKLTVCVENVFRFEKMRETPLPSRLAAELDAIDHPYVRATLDVSHAYQHCTPLKVPLLPELVALAPYAKHVHVHDSFGLPLESWSIDEGERAALGEGDLHLPLGWGDLPWSKIAEACVLPPRAVINLELHRRYWSELPAQIEVLRRLGTDFAATAAPAVAA